MLHGDGIKLNCGRNALAYLVESRGIKKMCMPKFMCGSCDAVLKKYGVSVRHYSVDERFLPVNVQPEDGEYIYVVNFYGQLSDSLAAELKSAFKSLILDDAQSYFSLPLPHVDTIYTCRKFFGVADGAILFSDAIFPRNLQTDESFDRMHFLLGRFERSANDFYPEYVANNDFFADEPIKFMSKLTQNLLRGIDYEFVKNRRTRNFSILHDEFASVNRLKLFVPQGAFMYPLFVKNGGEIRKKLQQKKIYVPTLWNSVFEICSQNELEFDMAENILPLPVDQRYDDDDMKYLICEVKKCIG
jgi:hypothetical protein